MQCVWVNEQQGAARVGRGRKQRGSGGVQEKNNDFGCGDCLTAQSPVSVLTNCTLARHVSNVWNGEYHALWPNSLGDGGQRCLCLRNQSGQNPGSYLHTFNDIYCLFNQMNQLLNINSEYYRSHNQTRHSYNPLSGGAQQIC